MRLLGLTIAAGLIGTIAAHGLETVLVAGGFDRPVFVGAPAGDGRRFIVEQRGTIQIGKDGAVLPTPFLDIDSLVINPSVNDERGLLGLAFHPDYVST